MLFDIPDHQTLYQALVSRNELYDGRVYVCVSSTGIFCRLSCVARKPKPENCTFFGSIGECMEAGYRPCLRCHPLQQTVSREPVIAALIAELDRRPGHRWTEQDIMRLGHDPSTVRRAFRRHLGRTFLELARQRRLREGFTALAEGDKVIMAQQDAGYQSPNAFREAFARLMGASPSQFGTRGVLLADWFATPLGDMICVASARHLHLLEFADRKALPVELHKLRENVKGDLGIGRYAPTEQVRDELGSYFAEARDRFEVPLALHGSEFTRAVWMELQRIPAGHTRSYSEIARRLGHPSAVRAVARANGANQISIVIPCHRVIGADGALTGYGGGLWRKQKLIEIERNLRDCVTQDRPSQAG
ncbi:MAG: bifunctional transcriptional activator/DNA repair protein Ada [Aestuariivirga sp.]|uniref:bifunctional transcriptional activator/DNA repair enzyme AdaA n=1 Tax=Aestuariivirga sp. TaxID=2650926 RepID=UPI0025BCADB3|nr:trifunctional transcriptional activator/DNA repair protein Ada/methylated-DNA--[protein]-cysteine S-methyltransferase [Aestuariivirga sp.]MCA3560013.1 bifunctional transcriptional activator/DNA repair protein Ada [Aestuariivirga sp.]